MGREMSIITTSARATSDRTAVFQTSSLDRTMKSRGAWTRLARLAIVSLTAFTERGSSISQVFARSARFTAIRVIQALTQAV